MRLPPALARLRRWAGGRTLWPGEAGSTGALDGLTPVRFCLVQRLSVGAIELKR